MAQVQLFGRMVEVSEQITPAPLVKRFGVWMDSREAYRNSYDYAVLRCEEEGDAKLEKIEDFLFPYYMANPVHVRLARTAVKAGVKAVTVEIRFFHNQFSAIPTGSSTLYDQSGKKVHSYTVTPDTPLLAVWNNQSVMRLVIMVVLEDSDYA